MASPIEIPHPIPPIHLPPPPPAPLPTTPAVPLLLVQGTARRVDGEIVPDLHVQAFDVDLRHRQLLGDGRTDPAGNYSISYSPTKFRRQGKIAADLLILGLDDKTGVTLVQSSILFHAPSPATVDVVIGGPIILGKSEFDQLLNAITPLLDGVDPANLVENADNHDLTYLVGEAGVNMANLELLVQAHSFSKATDVTPAIFYGLFRMDVPTDMAILLQKTRETLLTTLNMAVDENIIVASTDVISTALDTLLKRAIESASSTTDRLLPMSKAGLVLKGATPNPVSVMDAFSKAQSTEAFWTDLKARPETKDHIDALQFSVQLGTLTLNHQPLTDQLMQKKASGKIKTYADLAKFRQSDWLTMVKSLPTQVPDEIPGATPEEKAQTYVTAITNLVEDSLPTQFVFHRLSDADDSTSFKTPAAKKDVISFFETNPDFDITTTRLSEFVSKNQDSLKGLQDPESVKLNIAGIQRLHAVAPRYSQIQPLISDGIHSALQIVRMSQPVFMNKYSTALGGAREAQLVFERAEYTHSSAFNLLTNFGMTGSRPNIPVLIDHGRRIHRNPPKEIPDWSTLFGSMDMCSCDGCHAMDSPAAYLVDLLHFLKDRKLAQAVPALGSLEKNAKNVLFLRRPDLGTIELTCDNTNTPLPYIDLTVEILENAVSPLPPFTSFQLPTTAGAALDADNLDTLRSLFNPPLSKYAMTTAINLNTHWRIEEPSFTYNIERSPLVISVTSRTLQTTGTAQERAANPQYINYGAYDILSAAVYPRILPFDISWETVRAYLQHLTVNRSQLMECFSAASARDALTDYNIAIEYLGISVAEANILNGTTMSQPGAASPGLWNLWGFKKATLDGLSAIADPANKEALIQSGVWSAVLLSRVDVFLQQSGLSYVDLLNLLEIASIFGLKSLPSIAALDGFPVDTCQLNQLRILGVAEVDLHSFICFIRLDYILEDWSMIDLAKAFRTLKPATTVAFSIDNNMLVALSHIQRLHVQLQLPVDTILAFYGDLETKIYTDHANSDDTASQKSSFDAIYNNVAIIGQPDLKFRSNATSLPGTLTDFTLPVTAALNVTSDELTLLLGSKFVIGPTPSVTIQNLSALYRHRILAGSLNVSIADYIVLLKLMQISPFSATVDTLLFTKRSNQVLSSGFSLPELNYLLRHDYIIDGSVGPSESGITSVLDDLRSRLRAVSDDNTFQDSMVDEKGDAVKKKLALLLWDASVITQVVGIFSDTASAEVLLASAPPGDLIFPSNADATYIISKDLQNKLSYDPGTLKLSFRGTMTLAEKALLLDPKAVLPAVVTAQIPTLFDAPRTFLARNARSFSVPDYTTPLQTLPAGVTIPTALGGRVYYDPTAGLLHSKGSLSAAERDALIAGAPDTSTQQSYIDAVQKIYLLPDGYVPDVKDQFLTAANVATLFDSATDNSGVVVTPRLRFTFLLQKLLPYLLNSLSDQAVTAVMIQNLGLDSVMTGYLLDKASLPSSPTASASGPPAKLVPSPLRSIFRSPVFATTASKVGSSRALFSNQFQAFELLWKISIVVSRFRFTAMQLKWLFEFRGLQGDPTVGWLDLSALPLQFRDDSSDIFKAWERLAALTALRDSIPGGERTLDAIFNTARATTPGPTQDALLLPLEGLLKSSMGDVQYLVSSQGFNLAIPGDFKDEAKLSIVFACLRIVQNIGCSAADAKSMAQSTVSVQTSRIAIQAAKSRYDQTTWDSIARPLRNILREKQRAALVTYLISNQAQIALGGQFWRNSLDLFSYFLIDVDMGPCQLTSRIKQAICSIQLFVQRCLLNLEPNVNADTGADPGWDEWSWMKYQNVHGANMQVLMNPENYMVPELRDDQTDFFIDLRSELQQADLTSDTATAAFKTYLEKLNDVSRLEMVSFFQEEEGLDGTGNPAVDILHVLARTRSQRPNYYYRKRIDSASWVGGWTKLDADLEGDHIMPVVWNRKLFIFWALFTQKQDAAEVEMPKAGHKVKHNPGYLDISLAWTVRNDNGKFDGKRLAANTFRYYGGIADKDGITLKCAVEKDGGALEVQLEGSNRIGIFRFTGINGDPMALSPKDLGKSTPFVPQPRTQVYGMAMREVHSRRIQSLKVVSGNFLGKTSNTLVLGMTPGSLYDLVCAPQDPEFTSQRPFFFQHDQRSFFIEPKELFLPPIWLSTPIKIDPSWMGGRLIGKYIAAQNPWVPKLEMPYPDKAIAGSLRNLPSIAVDHGVMTAIDDKLGGVNTEVIQSFSLAPTRVKVPPFRIHPDPIIVKQNFLPIPSPLVFSLTYKFSLAYHPFVKQFISHLQRDGLDGLLQRPVQLLGEDTKTFATTYSPNVPVMATDNSGQYAEEVVDFDGGLCSIYNWELFFHIPLMIADRLSKSQRFEESQRWFHYIFDPTDTSNLESPKRFWRTKKFFETTSQEYADETLPNVFRLLAAKGDPAVLATLNKEQLTAFNSLETSVQQWRKDPFQPWLVARMRTTAFQKMVVMKYLDNLIAWGDNLFRGDTIEMINEATQIYVLAAEILGSRPVEIPPRAVPTVQTFNSLEPGLDDVSNALVPIEELVPPSIRPVIISYRRRHTPVRPSMLFFCVPKNDKLLTYWDTISDRLFKIRNCMNLQGIVRQLPLFDPPIDPMLLVKAAASGVDISSALSDINAPLPNYRFQVMLQKAMDLVGELKALGSAIMGAMEKRDGEAIQLLRSKHEMAMNDVVKIVKEQTITEAQNNIEALRRTKATTQARFDHYAGLAFMNEWETTAMGLESGLLLGLVIESAALALAGGIFVFPDAKVGCPTTIGLTLGGSTFGKAAEMFAAFMHNNSALIKEASGMATTMGSYNRRSEEWDLQKTLATSEMKQIDSQIAAADVRVAIAQQDLANHLKATANSKEIGDYLRSKFNNVDLYDWTVGQLSTLYFQSYQLAYDLAKRTERAYQHELGIDSSDFIQFGYWDSLKKGLLAGEKLFADLKRMELAFLDADSREYEITQSISLAQLDPLALIQLRENQEAFFSLPEAIFDLSYPGHYFRRIKSLSLTIPAVVGPYTPVPATLSLLKSSIRTSPLLSGGKYSRAANTDIRFTDSLGTTQSIVTSSGQSDAGLFETNLRDDRTLPFERLGAISSWRIQFPRAFKSFDYRTLTTVVLNVRYTAREGGDALRSACETELSSSILKTISLAEAQSGLAKMLSLRHEPNGLYTFLTKQTSDGVAETNIDFSRQRFPYAFSGAGNTITVTRVQVFVFVNQSYTATYNAQTLQFWLDVAPPPPIAPPPAASGSGSTGTAAVDPGPPLALAPWLQGLRTSKDFNKPAGQWVLKGKLASGEKLVADAIDDILLVCYYSVKRDGS